ncbi:MAG: antitoxin [Verrucomicrobia bacterium]|nr:MAG: antitoxin [Verrucomicrobiota bacterium]
MKKEKYMDEEEKDFIESFERGEWQTVANVVKEAEASREYARNTLKKDKRINIRLSEKDIDDIRMIAVENGVPYQTLIASILHKFATGQLRDVSHV